MRPGVHLQVMMTTSDNAQGRVQTCAQPMDALASDLRYFREDWSAIQL